MVQKFELANGLHITVLVLYLRQIHKICLIFIWRNHMMLYENTRTVYDLVHNAAAEHGDRNLQRIRM